MNATHPTAPRAPIAVRTPSARRTATILREAAYVLHLTQRVKHEILSGTGPDRSYTATAGAAILAADSYRS